VHNVAVPVGKKEKSRILTKDKSITYITLYTC
jgi:hypothetical protein